MSQPAIIALDPGTTTGWAVRYGDGKWKRGQLGPEPHHLKLWHLLENFKPDVIVCEEFQFRPNPGRKMVVLDSKEYIGVAKLFASMVRLVQSKDLEHPKIQIQYAHQAKNFWTDKKVKKLDLWIPGKQHAMDATRHLLYYYVFTLGHKEVLDGLK